MAVRRLLLPSTGSSATIAIAVLFFLIGVSAARTPSILHGNEVPAADADAGAAVGDITLTVPTSELDNQIIRLPSDDESRQNTDPGSAEPIVIRSVPLTRIRFHDFRPIDRRHHNPAAFRSRLPNRLCRHHHSFHNIQPLLRPVDENMVPLSSDGAEKKEEVDEEAETVNWVRLPHHHHHHHRHHRHIHRSHDNDQDGLDGFSKYLMKHSYKFGRDKFRKHLNQKRRDQHADDNEQEEMNKREKGKKEAEGGIIKRVRKFLAHI